MNSDKQEARGTWAFWSRDPNHPTLTTIQPLIQLPQLILSPVNSTTPQIPPSFNGLKPFRISLQNGHAEFTVVAGIQTSGPALFA